MAKGEIKIWQDSKWTRISLYSEEAVERLERLVQIARRYQDVVNQCHDELDQFIENIPTEISSPEVNDGVKRTGSRVRPIGTRSIDYILRVAIRSDPNTHFSEIYPQMQALGWKTESETPRHIINNLSSVCRKHDVLVNVENERITITEAGRAFVQTLPILPLRNTPPEAP